MIVEIAEPADVSGLEISGAAVFEARLMSEAEVIDDPAMKCMMHSN